MKHKTARLNGPLLDAAVAMALGSALSPLPGARGPWSYSIEWADGGPIIEREGIHLTQRDGEWTATAFLPDGLVVALGPTALVAAMRAFVSAKLGQEIDLPR